MVKIARMVLFLVVSCFCFQDLAFAVGGSDIGDKIVKLQNELGKLKTEHTRQALLISELEQQLSVVRNNAMIDVQNVITSSTEKDSQADEVKGHISALKGDIDKLQQAVEGLKGEISDLKSKQEKAIKNKKDKQEEERVTLIKPMGSLLDDQPESNDEGTSSKNPQTVNPQTVKKESSDKLSSDHYDVEEDKVTEKVSKSKSKKKLTEEKATEVKNKEAQPAKKPAFTSEKNRKTTKPEVSEDESDTRDETELANDAIAEAEKLEAEDSSESSDGDSSETSEKSEDQSSDDGASADDESDSAQADDEESETDEAE